MTTASSINDTGALTPWLRAAMATALFAVDPLGLGGVLVRARAGPVRERWLEQLRQMLPAERPLRRLPQSIPDSRLLGGLDLAATLRAGRPVVERGLLADVDGGVLLLPMAERTSAGLAARLASVMDRGEVRIERDGITLALPGRFGLVALDEGDGDDERVPATIADRVGLWLDLDGITVAESELADGLWSSEAIVEATTALAEVAVDEPALEAICGAAWALGIDSLRAPMLALRAASAIAALDGRDRLAREDVTLAAQLVLAPRATRMPAAEDDEDQAPPDEPDAALPEETEGEEDSRPPESEQQQDDPADDETPTDAGSLEDAVLEAVAAMLPPDLLAQLRAAPMRRGSGDGGRSGAWRQGNRGRPAGIRRGKPERGMRLNVVETLRTAAPWQPLRRREQAARDGAMSRPRVEVRAEDFRVTRYRQPAETVTIFVVDASGSAALHRLAEAKGAVELLLADCYVRRDRVALIAFRGRDAEMLLPPTRSLVRAKRSLAGLPGGGGTPLAAGLDAARDLADDVQRRGATPIIVVLTDGQANIASDGKAGRAQAGADAEAAARRLAARGHQALVIDTGPRRRAGARDIAASMNARFLPLPQADARAVSAAVRAALPD